MDLISPRIRNEDVRHTLVPLRLNTKNRFASLG
jgi:hypothetical protein